MSLTADDLTAIKDIVNSAVDGLAIQTAKGFSEVHGKIGNVESRLGNVETRLGNVESRLGNVESRLGNVESELEEVKSTVGRIENIQRAEITRIDVHSKEINRIKQTLKIA